MHLLPCPSCQASIPVSPSQAGDTVACPSCHQSVDIPKLGELRQLPLAEPVGEAVDVGQPAGAESSRLAQTGFVLSGLVAAASLLVAGFCGIRWALTEVPNNTERHVAGTREDMSKFSAAELIRAYEDMDKTTLEMTVPFRYKDLELRKAKWGRNAIIAGSLGTGAVLLAVGLANAGRRKRN
jgi:hypothetical protein